MNCNIQKKKGKILGQFTLNAYSDEPALPEISPDDAGKALVIDENGNIVTGTVGGGDLYQHQITIESLAGKITTEITNTKSTAFTKDEFITFMTTPLKTLRCFCLKEESQGVQWYIYNELTLEWSEVDEEYIAKLYGGLEIYFSSGSIAMEEDPSLSIAPNLYNYTCPIDTFSDVVIQL